MVLALGLEGGAVGALRHGGVRLVSYNLNLGKRAVVLLAAMVGALGNGAADGLVGGVAGVSAAGILVLVHFFCIPFEIWYFYGLTTAFLLCPIYKRLFNFLFILLTKCCVCAIVKLPK